MKRKSSSSSNSSSPSSSASSSSSSCIEPNQSLQLQPKPKRIRAKKIQTQDSVSATTTKRSSIYRGVTRHRWTGRFEAHLWDRSSWNTIQNKKGRQIYLGAYDNEEAAAHTYDLAALKYWGPGTTLNFPIETYSKELEEMQKMSKEEYLASLRRRSSGFSRGVSKYRGVARHHHNGRWEARIGRVSGNKYLYLGTYSTQEEAAAAYDMAAIEFRGPNAVTNFDISNYADKLSKFLPGLQVKQEKSDSINEAEADEAHDHQHQVQDDIHTAVPSNTKLECITPPVQSQTDEPHHYKQYDKEEEVALIDEENQMVQLPVPKIELAMYPTEEHEHPWNLCLDLGFNSLPVSHDIPLEKPIELLGLFDDKGFEDHDIDFIFDLPFNENELQQDAMSGTAESKVEIDVMVDRKEKVEVYLTSPLSSSSVSTTTSVCSNN